MGLYTNYNFASIEEAYGSGFKSKTKKSSQKKSKTDIVEDPMTPDYMPYNKYNDDLDNERFMTPKPKSLKEKFRLNPISKDLYSASKDFANPWDQEMAYEAGGGTFNPYEEAQAMINPQTLEQKQYNRRVYAEPNIYNYPMMNKLPDGYEKRDLEFLDEDPNKSRENFQQYQSESFKNDVQMANIFMHIIFGVFVLYMLDKLVQLGRMLKK